MKKLFLITAFAFFTGTVSAAFGVVPYQTDGKLIQPRKDYTIGFINTEDYPLKITLEAERGGGYGIQFQEREFILQPSRTSENPKGSGWYYTGETYAKIQETGFEFTVFSNRTTNDFEFDVTVTARAENPGEGPDIQLVREIRYSLSSYGLMQGVGTDFNGDEKNNDVRFWDEDTQEQQETGEEPRDPENPGNETRPDKDGDSTTKKPGEDGGADAVTLVLLLGISAALLYIYRVV